MRKTVLVGLLLLDFSNPAASTIFVVPHKQRGDAQITATTITILGDIPDIPDPALLNFVLLFDIATPPPYAGL
jgi:hypothetical protein